MNLWYRLSKISTSSSNVPSYTSDPWSEVDLQEHGTWPKIEVFGHSNEQVKSPLKSTGACASMAQGFWPVPQVAHFPVNRCHTSAPVQIIWAGRMRQNQSI